MPITPDQLLALLDTFPWDDWNQELEDGLSQRYRDVLETSAGTVLDDFSFEDPFTSRFVTEYIGERIVTLDGFTRENVSQLIRRTLEANEGLSTFELGTKIHELVQEHFEGYGRWRADRIARTEVGFAQNHGTVLGCRQAGIDFVDVSDGDDDEPCRSAHGQIWPLERALADPLAHPNCVRAFSPHTGPVVDTQPSEGEE